MKKHSKCLPLLELLWRCSWRMDWGNWEGVLSHLRMLKYTYSWKKFYLYFAWSHGDTLPSTPEFKILNLNGLVQWNIQQLIIVIMSPIYFWNKILLLQFLNLYFIYLLQFMLMVLLITKQPFHLLSNIISLILSVNCVHAFNLKLGQFTLCHSRKAKKGLHS